MTATTTYMEDVGAQEYFEELNVVRRGWLAAFENQDAAQLREPNARAIGLVLKMYRRSVGFYENGQLVHTVLALQMAGIVQDMIEQSLRLELMDKGDLAGIQSLIEELKTRIAS